MEKTTTRTGVVVGAADPEEIRQLDVGELTKRMKQLDEESYRQFFHLYYRRLWAYLNIVSKGDHGEIEEALQLSFEKVVKHIRVFESEAEFWAWLSVVARNAYRDCQRQKMRIAKIFHAFGFNNQHDSEGIETESQFDADNLDNALLILNESELYLVRQKYFEGNSYRQIAEISGVTEKAIESRLARIRHKLRVVLLKDRQ